MKYINHNYYRKRLINKNAKYTWLQYLNHNYYRKRLINKNAKYTWLQYGQEYFRFISVLIQRTISSVIFVLLDFTFFALNDSLKNVLLCIKLNTS